ncbi:DUF6457 domain-containing protein [Nesterenkonia flava]|uniref:DUF6457 domain-containing protein n=1 Tax=Nesterenkonia flava TaxID=469799 RepID=A0ABU1FRF1_9MICC|nr:DUF6457 domain-containing protein [Nesterenkonia flava]MDR5711234.1 DUF6457 domain-containing protein [Nesterenkonia flava]
MSETPAAPENPAEKSGEALTREAIELWVAELAHHLEIDDVVLDVDAVLAIAGQAAHTVVRPAAPVTTFLIGYVAGLAEASGQADFEKAFRAATRVAEQLLARRSDAVG